MKRIIVILIVFVFAYKAQSQVALDSLLVKYYDLATTSKDNNLYTEKFFEIFPDNFQLFDSIYGWHEIGDSLYLHPLYFEAGEHIDFFFDLFNTMDKSGFVKKVINISLNGHYAVDAVNIFKHLMTELLLNNTEQFLKELALYTDTEIKSFWHFFFDNLIFDHPYCLKKHVEVYEKVKRVNRRILILMQEQYCDDFNEYLKHEYDWDNN